METEYPVSEIANPRRGRRWLKRIGCGLLVLLVPALTLLILGIGAWAWRHHVVQQRLDEALAELDRNDPGWRLEDIEAAREQIPEEENSARVIVAVARLLPKDWPSKEFAELFTHLPPQEQLTPDAFARLQQELESVRPALKEARKLADMPRGRHRITYQRNILNILLKDQDAARHVVWLPIYDAMRYEQKGDMTNTMICCRAAFHAARSLGDEPIAVSQLIRTAGVTSACQAMERALAQGEPAPEDLAALARLLDSEDAFPDLLITARGERALDQTLFDAIEGGEESITALADRRPNWHERLFGFLYRDNIRAEHPTMLALMSQWVAIVQLPMPEQADAEEQLNNETRMLPKSAILTRLLLPALTRLGEVSRRKHASLRCLMAALAAERYRRQHKQWPDTLDKLCPQFLAAVPSDPFDGEPLRYCRVEDGIVIYTVGSDTIDNEGHLDRERSNQPGVDVGVRLWDIAQRRQPPRPKPQHEPNPR